MLKLFISRKDKYKLIDHPEVEEKRPAHNRFPRVSFTHLSATCPTPDIYPEISEYPLSAESSAASQYRDPGEGRSTGRGRRRGGGGGGGEGSEGPRGRTKNAPAEVRPRSLSNLLSLNPISSHKSVYRANRIILVCMQVPRL
jgi:hypothetical protein